jgi:selenoprotein W-related protein
LSAEILETAKTRLTGLTLVPSRGGCFEVNINGERIYSKLATGDFPEHAPILAAIAGRLARSGPY